MTTGARSLVEIGVLQSSEEEVESMKNSLLVTKLWLDGRETTGLIDSGATHNFVSEQWVKEAGIPMEPTGKVLTVTLADGRGMTVKEHRIKKVKCTMGEYQWVGSWSVIPMTSYNVVLGKPWLTNHNPRIDFSTNTLVFGTGESCQCRNDVADNGECSVNVEEALFLNVRQARKELKRGAECIIVKVDAAEDQDNGLGGLEALNIADDLDQSKREEILGILGKHERCFPRELPMRLPPERRVSHEIKVEEGAKPPSRPPFRMSSLELDELQRQLHDLLSHGFIEPSCSPYGAPVFFIKKPDGSLRMVCDWRPLNKITVKVQACLPNIEDLFDTIRGAKYFSRLDLKSGYHQVRVCDADVSKTAINTPFGQYQFRVMGFGLTNAPATFMALMNDVMRPYLRKCVVIFLDDILVFSNSWQEHLSHLDSILSALEEAELFCNGAKCLFAVQRVKFLGHIVTGETVAPDPEKLAAITKWPVPTSVREVRRFLGFTNYFRRFIQNYSMMSRPLELLTGKYAKFVWSADHQEAFEKLRAALLEAPVLGVADMSKSFRVVTDASDQAIGAVLLQADEEGEWHPIAYLSRRLRPEECNYTAMERETLAAVHALRSWKHYLYKPFQLVTDNQGVTYLKSKPGLSKREARWVEFLADFEVDIIHCPGKQNVADALSRVDEAPRESSVTRVDDGNLAAVQVTLLSDPDFKKQLARGYRTDRKLRHIIKRLKKNPGTQGSYQWDGDLKCLFLVTRDEKRLCIPKGRLRIDILRWCHDNCSAGHPGRDRTYSRIAREYYWPRLGRDVKRYVQSCPVCQTSKGDRPRQPPLQPLPVPEKPWEEISMDLITGLPESTASNDTILTFVDRLTKQAHFVPTTVDSPSRRILFQQGQRWMPREWQICMSGTS